ncbi:DUF4130 domain-containing protein [Paracoccus suum]|uniref:Type-4 uracil-DNA glycosylase n=2 Tax=Paracoccus suum TaxID=2259340 RepID=A0A344PNS8_9RHOB|nr:DUF4130 domain-containing protein [Paracoccus suum]
MAAWREAARGLAAAGVPAADVAWHGGEGEGDLFAASAPAPRAAQPGGGGLSVPKDFLSLAELVLAHRDPEAPGLLYTLLLRLQAERGLLADPADPLVRRVQVLAKAVRRDMHKMRAFVRFRELPTDQPRRRFAAWFEPDHRIVGLNAPFFARRFADMDWAIHTPDASAIFEDGTLRMAAGADRPDLPDDAHEALWATYFANIFNPARIKLDAMRSEMPQKYWKNLPETNQIPAMLAAAEGRVAAMRAAEATEAPGRASAISARYRKGMPAAPAEIRSLDDARAACGLCTRCDLYQHATQAVFGEGAPNAALMIVGEQPGDHEDLAGRPFVGPAGQVLDEAMAKAGVQRPATWLTNAVKHFKFTPRGKRRLHQTPNAGEVQACRWWLAEELRLVRPKLTMGLGGTAALALTGRKEGITRRRGKIEDTPDGPVLLSWHPSYILRIPDAAAQEKARAELLADLEMAREVVG